MICKRKILYAKKKNIHIGKLMEKIDRQRKQYYHRSGNTIAKKKTTSHNM